MCRTTDRKYKQNINQFDLLEMYKMLLITIGKYIFFSHAFATFIKVENMLNH